MGGSVAVTVRFEDGQVVPMSRWTNTLAGWLQARDFVEQSEAVLRNYVSKRPRDDRWNQVSPYSYGLVVIDAKSRTVLSMQDYTTLDRLSQLTIANALDPTNGQGGWRAELEWFLEQGKLHPVLKRAGDFRDVGNDYDTLDPISQKSRLTVVRRHNLATWERLDREARNREPYRGTLKNLALWCDQSFRVRHDDQFLPEGNVIAVGLDLSPWSFEDFPRTKKGSRKMRARIASLGFRLTRKEQRTWRRWIEAMPEFDWS